MRVLGTALALASLAAAFGACGGGGGSPTGAGAQPATSAPATTSTSAGRPANAAPVTLGSPADVPRAKGGDNSIQDFGQEASRSDRAAAARVLAAFLAAYPRGDGGTACALLASASKEMLEQTFTQAGKQPGAGSTQCSRILSLLGAGLPAEARRHLSAARVLSLRIEGDRAFAIYVGTDGEAHYAPMTRESGAWKVASIAGSPL